MTPLEWWSTFGLGAGTGVLLVRLYHWLRLHERDATPSELERVREALRRQGPRAL